MHTYSDYAGYDGFEDAMRRIRRNTSPRQRRLQNYEDWVFGKQYDGRSVDWLDNSSDTPLWERRPCVVYQIARSAIDSNGDLLLGKGKFPKFTARPGEDEADLEDGLNDADSAALDQFIMTLVRQTRFESHARHQFFQSQACGTCVGLFGVRNGKLFADAVPAKHATAKFDKDGNVTALEIKYPYLDEVRDEYGRTRVVAKIFRRVIDHEKDVTFKPADAAEDANAKYIWGVDEDRSVRHNLGFCPVVWHRHMAPSTLAGENDGHAIHSTLLNQIRALDFVLSQEHRAALFSEPQIVEIGVAEGHNPTASGRNPNIVPATAAGGDLDILKNPATASYGVAGVMGGGSARRRGPGYVWRYPNPETRVEVLDFGKDVLAALQQDAESIREKILEQMAVVFLDSKEVKKLFQLSGKALAALRQRQIDRCDQYRDDFGELYMLRAVHMLLRIVYRITSSGNEKALRIAGLQKVKRILEATQGEPRLTLAWGAYTTHDEEDRLQMVTATVNALQGGLITLPVAVRNIAQVFGIESVDEVVKELEENQEADLQRQEASQKQQHEFEMQKIQAKAPAKEKP